MSVELLIFFLTNQFIILAFGIALWVGGWWALRDFRRHMNRRFDRLDEGFRLVADEIRGLTRELAEFRGEMRAGWMAALFRRRPPPGRGDPPGFSLLLITV